MREQGSLFSLEFHLVCFLATKDFFQGVETLLQLRDLHFLLFQFGALFLHPLVQPLNGRKRHAAFIQRRDVPVVGANLERRAKVLSYRTKVARRRIVLVPPFAQRQARDFFENLRGVDRGKILFGVTVALIVERAVDRDAAAGGQQSLR